MKFQLYQPEAIYEIGQRGNQEDSIYPSMGEATPQNRLFLVCDGMGGHENGEVASAAVCRGLSQAIEPLLNTDGPFTEEQFHAALNQTYQVLDAADVKQQGKMGTTMTLLCLHKGGALVAHIGDSRIYHLRPKTGEVLYRSRDHSLVQQLYELGEISYNGMKTSPRKNVILRAMQPYQETRAQATLAYITDIQPGDYFYMCSDGMLEEMEDNEIMSVVGARLSDREKADELIRRTMKNADNHSAYLIGIKEVETEAGDNLYPSNEAELRAKNKALNDTRKNEAWDMAPNGQPQQPMAYAGTAAAMQQPVRQQASLTSDQLKKYLPLAILLLIILVLAILLMVGGSSKPVVNDHSDKNRTERVDNRRQGNPTAATDASGTTETKKEKGKQ